MSKGKTIAKAALNLTDWVKKDIFGNGKEILYTSPDGAKSVLQQTVPSGKTFYYPDGDLYKPHGTIEDAVSAIKGKRISDTLKQRNAEKYGAVPKLWSGEEKKIAKRLIDEGVDIAGFSGSSQSQSKYIDLMDGTKIRLSDHDLPPKYEGADINHRYGSDIDSLVNKIKSYQSSSDSITGTAPYLAGGAIAAGSMAPQQSQAAQDVQQLRNAHADYSTRRAQKSGYWKARRDDVLNLARSVGSFAEDVAFPALDKPMQGIYGMTGAMAALARGQSFDDAIRQGAQLATQPVEQTAYNMGATVNDALSPYLPAPVAAGAGTAVNVAGQIISPF